LGSILYLHTVPPVGGDTLFASQYAAYDALSPRMKAYLEGLTATHSGEHVYRATNVLVGRDDRGKVFPKAAPGAYVRRDGRECPAPMHRPRGAICIAGGWRLVTRDRGTTRQTS
jgi:TfdA family taurine catabolism dioxygenase TauD